MGNVGQGGAGPKSQCLFDAEETAFGFALAVAAPHETTELIGIATFGVDDEAIAGRMSSQCASGKNRAQSRDFRERGPDCRRWRRVLPKGIYNVIERNDPVPLDQEKRQKRSHMGAANSSAFGAHWP